MEGLAFSGRFSLPIQVFVPVFFNSRRIFSLVEWTRAEFSKVGEENSGSTMRAHIGRGLAMANMALWCYNLFGFLLPVFLPKALRKYYSVSKSEVESANNSDPAPPLFGIDLLSNEAEGQKELIVTTVFYHKNYRRQN
ncbi:hypothetical protein U1Q18_004595 [Sarracenia purpurea var. burkii]